MTDTPADVEALHRRLLMARSGEERVRMAASMSQMARDIVWSGIPKDLPETDRRVLFLSRYYGDELAADVRYRIASRHV